MENSCYHNFNPFGRFDP